MMAHGLYEEEGVVCHGSSRGGGGQPSSSSTREQRHGHTNGEAPPSATTTTLEYCDSTIATASPPFHESVVVVEDYHHHLNNHTDNSNNNGNHRHRKYSIGEIEAPASNIAEHEEEESSCFSSLDDSNSQHFHPLGLHNSTSVGSSLVLSGRHSDFTVPTSNHAASLLHRSSPPLVIPQQQQQESQQHQREVVYHNDDDDEQHKHYGDYSQDYRGRRSIFGQGVEQRYHHHNVNTTPEPLRLLQNYDAFFDFGNGCDGFQPSPTALSLPTTSSLPQQQQYQTQQPPMSPLFYLPSVNPYHEHFVFSRIRNAGRNHLPMIASQNLMETDGVAESSSEPDLVAACPDIRKIKKIRLGAVVAPCILAPRKAAAAPTNTTTTSTQSRNDDIVMNTPAVQQEQQRRPSSSSSSQQQPQKQQHRRSSSSSVARRKSSALSSHNGHHHHHHHKKDHKHAHTETTIHAQSLLLGLAFAAVWSPFNIMAPNLTEMADTFHFTTAQERDLYLGSYAALATSVFSFPIGAGIGILTDFYSRKRLFVATVLLGALSALGTGCSGSYSSYSFLLLSRLLSGGFMAGSVPVAFSFLGDLFSVQERNAASSGLTAMMGLGIIAGQVYAGLVGPRSPSGWQHAFYVSSAISIVLAILCMIFVHEPERGGKEKVLQDMIKAGTRYDRKLSWSVFYNVVRNNKSTLILLWQGFFSSIPWGVIFTFLNDVLSQEQGLSVPAATYLVFWYGVGCAAGGIAGGYWGQKLQDINRTFLPLFMGITTALGIVPFWWLLTRPLTVAKIVDGGDSTTTATPTTAMAVVLAFLCGFVASLPSVNVRPILINVNPPETRGASLTAANILINLGRGVGPSCVTFFTWISTTYLNKGSLSSLLYHGHYQHDDDDDDDDSAVVDQVFGSPRLHAILSILCIFWIVSALLLFLLMRTVPLDQDRMEADLAVYAEQAMLSMHGKKTSNLTGTELATTGTADMAFERRDLEEQDQSPLRRTSYQSVDDENGDKGLLATTTPSATPATDLPDWTTPTRRSSINPILSLLLQSGTGGTTASLLATLSSPCPAVVEEVSIEDRMTSFDSVAARQTLVYICDGIKELGEEVMLKKNQKLCQPCHRGEVQESSEEEYSSDDSNDDGHEDDSNENDNNDVGDESSSPRDGRAADQQRHMWQQQQEQHRAQDSSTVQEDQSPLRRPVNAPKTTTTLSSATKDDDTEHPTEKTPLLV